jgi:hypothetical protein
LQQQQQQIAQWMMGGGVQQQQQPPQEQQQEQPFLKSELGEMDEEDAAESNSPADNNVHGEVPKADAKTNATVKLEKINSANHAEAMDLTNLLESNEENATSINDTTDDGTIGNNGGTITSNGTIADNGTTFDCPPSPLDEWRPTAAGSALRSRSFLSDEQLKLLADQFRRNPLPSKYELSALAEKCAVNKRVVQVWFQNMRAKVI